MKKRQDCLIIRPAHRADAELLLGFIKELAEYERLASVVTATTADLEHYLFSEDPKAEVLLAFWEYQPAGFALYFHNFSTFLGRPGIYLEDLFVKAEFRGSGIGKALLVQLAGLCAERNCGRLEWSVLDWNEPTIKFYESLGAVAQDGWTVYRLTGEALAELGKRVA